MIHSSLRRTRGRAVAGALACALLCLALGACGSSSSSNGSVLTEAGDEGGPYALNLNPLSSGSALTGVTNSWPFVYETLLQFNYANSDQVTPWLATSYRWTNGHKTVVFTIRSGVKWSDGQPFTAQDVAFTFNLLKRFPALNLYGVQFQSVAATSPSSVTLNLSTVDVPNLYFIGTQPILPQHIWSAIKNPVNFLNPHPVGTGPFTVKAITTQDLVFQRNPHYWGPEPAMSELNYPALYTNATSAAALDDDQAQWGDVYIADLKTFVGSGTGTHKVENPPLFDINLIPNVKKYPLNLLPLRQAISDASTGLRGQRIQAKTRTRHSAIPPGSSFRVTPPTSRHSTVA